MPVDREGGERRDRGRSHLNRERRDERVRKWRPDDEPAEDDRSDDEPADRAKPEEHLGKVYLPDQRRRTRCHEPARDTRQEVTGVHFGEVQRTIDPLTRVPTCENNGGRDQHISDDSPCGVTERIKRVRGGEHRSDHSQRAKRPSDGIGELLAE